MASVTNCEKYPGCENCPDTDNDYCEGTKRLKKELRDKRVENSLKYLDKHGFEYKETKTPNIVKLKYPAEQYRFSLKEFKICVYSNWIRKDRGKLLKPGTEIEFGKYKGKKMNEINDPDYIKWLLHATNTMIHPDCFLKAKLTN